MGSILRNRMTFPFNLPAVPILTEYEAEADETGEQQNKYIRNVIAEQEFEQELARMARIKTPRPLSKTSVLVTTDGRGVVQIDFCKTYVQDFPYRTTGSVINV